MVSFIRRARYPFLYGLCAAIAIATLGWWYYASHGVCAAECPHWLRVFLNEEREFDSCVSAIENKTLQPAPDGRYAVPPALQSIGVLRIDAIGSFIVFKFRLRWIDGPWEIVAWDRSRGPLRTIELARSLTHGNLIYRIQQCRNGWYYCMYD
jgi:hypothetical protein